MLLDKLIDLLRILLGAQQRQVHHHDTGIDVAGLFGQMQPSPVKVFEGPAFDVRGGGKQIVPEVNLVQTAQGVDDNEVGIEVQNAVELLGKILCGKQAVVHLLWIAVGDRSILKHLLRKGNINQFGSWKNRLKRSKIVLGQAVVCNIDGENARAVRLRQRIKHGAQHL